MKRATQYQIALAALALATCCAGAYAAYVKSVSDQLQRDVNKAEQRATESSKAAAKALQELQEVKVQLVQVAAAKATLQLAVAAFSQQAEACQSVTQPQAKDTK